MTKNIETEETIKVPVIVFITMATLFIVIGLIHFFIGIYSLLNQPEVIEFSEFIERIDACRERNMVTQWTEADGGRYENVRCIGNK